MEQIRTTSDVLIKKNVINRISDVPGGVSIALAALVVGNIVEEGTPLSVPASGLRAICKQALILAGPTTTTVPVAEGIHNFKVGNFITIGESKISYAITDISNAAGVDTLTVGTAIDLPVEGDHIYEAADEQAGANSTFLNVPDTIIKEAFEVPSTSQVIWMGDALIHADVAEDAIGAEYLAYLKTINVVKY